MTDLFRKIILFSLLRLDHFGNLCCLILLDLPFALMITVVAVQYCNEISFSTCTWFLVNMSLLVRKWGLIVTSKNCLKFIIFLGTFYYMNFYANTTDLDNQYFNTMRVIL